MSANEKTEGSGECDPVDEAQGEKGKEGEDRDGEDFEEQMSAEDSGEVKASRSVARPYVPTLADRKAHESTHCPFRSWCIHCVRGQAAEYPHRTVSGEAAESEVPRVSMDYCYFKEDVRKMANEHVESEEAATSLTALAMKETQFGSVWAYALRSKSVAEEAWLADQIADDLSTIGMSKERIICKSDQESAITELQGEIAKKRADVGTALENSKVGDSNSNGRVERSIRDMKGMVRTLKSALAEKLNMPVTLDMAIVPWMIRHAAYLITRCRVRKCGKTALQLIKGRKSLTELIPFGELVLFKVPKTAHAIGSFEERWESGVWLGSTIRDGMHLIGTGEGVFKVGTIRARPDGENWSQEAVKSLVGSPEQPQPSTGNRKIITYAKKKGDNSRPEPGGLQPPTDELPEPRSVRITKQDIEKHGATAGCPGCRAIIGNKPWR